MPVSPNTIGFDAHRIILFLFRFSRFLSRALRCVFLFLFLAAIFRALGIFPVLRFTLFGREAGAMRLVENN
jgi:hypothetical protein